MAYDVNYFEWQKEMGHIGGIINSPIFNPYLRADDTTLDFGCGGGYLLNNLKCKSKAGVEINSTARQQAHILGLTTYETIDAVPDGFASLVISNHALEHVESPLEALSELKPKIEKNGRLVFVVPHECLKAKWLPDDINQHLYTWNPMTLGNLFSRAGYRVCTVEPIRHRWPSSYLRLYRYFGPNLFQMFCKLEAYRIGCNQLRIVAEKY